MQRQTKIRLTFASILVLTVITGFIGVPGGPDIAIGSWQRELKVPLGLDLQGGIHLVYEADVSSLPPQNVESAIDGARDVIERRVNLFGVSEPLVQTSQSGDSWRVIVELAGVFDVDEAISLIGDTPILEFREEGEASDEEAATIHDDIEAFNAEAKTRAEAVLGEVLTEGADFTALANQYSEDPGNTDPDGNKLGGELGFATSGTFVEEFDDALFNKLEDDQVLPELVETVFGWHIIYRESSQTNDDDVLEVKSKHILIGKRSEADVLNQLSNYQPTELNGQHLRSASVQFDQTTGEPIVTLEFNDEGAELFAEITKNNIGKTVAIFLDDAPISVPVVNHEITDGQAIISGSFTLDDAKDLTNRLNAGALPVPLNLISQQTVGATLGQQSVQNSLFAGVLGIILVAIFMVLYYRLPGLLAVFALALYALIVLAVFKLWPVTLTLAGVAGFILSIGMAVDANVLIFERMKEELQAGRPLVQAIEEGFKRAWLSIRDSNISSLITTVILYLFSTSLIRGFAVTLSIGILVSMFSAIIITRTFLRLVASDWFARRPALFAFLKK